MSTDTFTPAYPVAELYVDTIGVSSVPIDWEAASGIDGDGWESFEAPECYECGEYAVRGKGEYGGEAWICGNAECPDHGDEFDPHENGNGPVMNYHYPLPDLRRIGGPYAAAEAIADLPLCVVEFDDGSYSLALTGGGMDLSWEICEAFTRLGFLPPMRFADLPRMAGYPRTPEHRYVVEACLRSCDVAVVQAERTRETLRGILEGSE